MLARRDAWRSESARGLGSTTAPHGWTRSTTAAAEALLAPLLGPRRSLGAAIFGAAAAVLGPCCEPRHVAVALVGALLWAAGLDAALAWSRMARLATPRSCVAAALVVVTGVRRRERSRRRPQRAYPGAAVRGRASPNGRRASADDPASA